MMMTTINNTPESVVAYVEFVRGRGWLGKQKWRDDHPVFLVKLFLEKLMAFSAMVKQTPGWKVNSVVVCMIIA